MPRAQPPRGLNNVVTFMSASGSKYGPTFGRFCSAEPEDTLAKMKQDLVRTQTAQAIGKFFRPLPDRGLVKGAH